MSRNVTIVVIILIVVLVAAWLVYLRNRFIETNMEASPSPVATVAATESPTSTPTASPSATPKSATTSGQLKTASPSAKAK
jgi:cytoskeletal protein RodZ